MPYYFSSGAMDAVADAESRRSLSCKKWAINMKFCSKTPLGPPRLCLERKRNRGNHEESQDLSPQFSGWGSSTIVPLKSGRSQQHRGNRTTTANWQLSNVRDQFRPALLRQTAPDSGENRGRLGQGTRPQTSIHSLNVLIYLSCGNINTWSILGISACS